MSSSSLGHDASDTISPASRISSLVEREGEQAGVEVENGGEEGENGGEELNEEGAVEVSTK